jgi:hypothetical protein
MVRHLDIRGFARLFAFLTGAAFAFSPAAFAQSGAPIKVGYAISQTGGLAGGGNSALLARRSGRRLSMPKEGCLADPSSSFIMMIRAVRRRCPGSIRSCWTSTRSMW